MASHIKIGIIGAGSVVFSLGLVKDLYYDYILTRNVCLSQHDVNNSIRLEYYESGSIYNLLVRARQAFTVPTAN